MSNIFVPTKTSSIDWDAAQEAMLQCARHEADALLVKAATFVSKAQNIMAKAQEPVQNMIAKAQEPIFPLESCAGNAFLDTDTEVWSGSSLDTDTQVWSDSSEGAYVTASRARPSKAPRLQ